MYFFLLLVHQVGNSARMPWHMLKAVQNLIKLMPVKDVLPLSFQMPLAGPVMLDAEQLSWDLLKMNVQGPALQ